MSIVTITVIFFLLMDPFGNLNSFLSMTEGLAPSRKRLVALREMSIALAAVVLFYLIGEFVLSTLQISEPTVRITSGLILFLIALKILFPAKDSLRANLQREEPFITPFAIPLIAGPALLATSMLFGVSNIPPAHLLGAVLGAWIAATIIIIMADPIRKTLGQNGLDAVERMMGMVLILLAIQRTLEGIQAFIPMYCQA